MSAATTDHVPAHARRLAARLSVIHWQIHGAFSTYQAAAEQRRQLAVDVGEISQQFTDALCAAGYTAEQARQANVHQLAEPASS
jgi:hypothetical protein